MTWSVQSGVKGALVNDDLPLAQDAAAGATPGPYVFYPGVHHDETTHELVNDDLPTAQDAAAGNQPWLKYYPSYFYHGPAAAPFYVPVNTFEFSATALVQLGSQAAISQDVTTEFEATGQAVFSTNTSLVRQRTFSGGDAVELNSQGDFEAPTDLVVDALSLIHI